MIENLMSSAIIFALSSHKIWQGKRFCERREEIFFDRRREERMLRGGRERELKSKRSYSYSGVYLLLCNNKDKMPAK
jgi:hypothetical protein